MLSAVACGPENSTFAPCGNNQHASAKAILPDTGINAGREIDVNFLQQVPTLTWVAVQQGWPAGANPDPEPNPRVRLVSASGQVFVDTVGTRFDQPEGRYDDPTWYVLHDIPDAQLRNALYNAFATQSLWLELWHADAASPGTRILLTTTDYGVYPPALCG